MNSEILPFVQDVDLTGVSSIDHLRSHHHTGTNPAHLGAPQPQTYQGADGKIKIRRNTWNEKKNSILVEVVKNCKYPTPWRPKHGTNKEIWQDIANQMMLRNDVFDTPVHWESAKDQLLKIIDRQRLRRSLGDYSIKSETELFVDEMIKHVTADDEEKMQAMKKQKDRASKRQFRRSSGDMSVDLDGRSDYDDDDEDIEQDKRAKIGEAVGDVLSHRLLAELQNCKQMTKAGNELASSSHIDNTDALALVQQQLSSCQAVLSTAQALLLRLMGGDAQAQQATAANGSSSSSSSQSNPTPSISVSKN